MATTAAQKFAALILPVSAVALAFATSDADWNPKRVQRSWRETMHPELAAASPDAKSAPPETPPAPDAGGKPAPGKPGKKHGNGKGAPPDEKPPVPDDKPPVPEGQGDPYVPPAVPIKVAAPAGPPEIEFRVTGLIPAKTASPLTIPAAMRMDVHITSTEGLVRLGTTPCDAEKAKTEIHAGSAEKKEKGLLYVVPNQRAGWDLTRDIVASGVASGWTTIGFCVADPDKPGVGRVLLVDVPATEAPTKKGLDILRVLVTAAGGGNSSWKVNGETCATEESMKNRVLSLHKEYEEGFEAGYASEADETPWIIEGAGAPAAGVIAALDALRAAGAKAVRLEGIQRIAK